MKMQSRIVMGRFMGGEVSPGVFHGGDIEPGTFHNPVPIHILHEEGSSEPLKVSADAEVRDKKKVEDDDHLPAGNGDSN